MSNCKNSGIEWPILKEYLIQDEKKEFSYRDFGKDIIPTMLTDGLQMYVYQFNNYWKDVGTVHSYWQANLDLLNKEKNIFMQNSEWKIHTVEKNVPPLYLAESAKVYHSILSEGCELSGTIEKSVIFSGVKIAKGASIKNSVILPGTIVEENVWIENAVIGSNSVIKNGVIMVSSNPEEHLMLVGNHKTIDPTLQEMELMNRENSVLS
ncbi:sugar phosphate nucleotidyltransferase [Neobacillus drentensis]|uniref:sugar phosphate nucleotidyltransferase n=1 Tax=Neobacillus drentensis TaxID=220684 RepID=UPI003001DC4F